MVGMEGASAVHTPELEITFSRGLLKKPRAPLLAPMSWRQNPQLLSTSHYRFSLSTTEVPGTGLSHGG